MSDLSDPTQDLDSESLQQNFDFLRKDLADCFLFLSLAETERDENSDDEAAARFVGQAEDGYLAMVDFLSDPKHAAYITDEQRRGVTAVVERLREKLDGLKR